MQRPSSLITSTYSVGCSVTGCLQKELGNKETTSLLYFFALNSAWMDFVPIRRQDSAGRGQKTTVNEVRLMADEISESFLSENKFLGLLNSWEKYFKGMCNCQHYPGVLTAKHAWNLVCLRKQSGNSDLMVSGRALLTHYVMMYRFTAWKCLSAPFCVAYFYSTEKTAVYFRYLSYSALLSVPCCVLM